MSADAFSTPGHPRVAAPARAWRCLLRWRWHEPRRGRSVESINPGTGEVLGFLGTPFGGVKQSGIGREECIEEMLSFTRKSTSTSSYDR